MMTGEEITDRTSGLFSEAYLRASLPARVASGRRSLNQLGLVLVAVEAAEGTELDTEALGEIARRTLRDSDLPCRMDDGTLALLLEFTPVDGSARAAVRVRDALLAHQPDLQVWAGAATYPVHALTAEELLEASGEALQRARQGAAGTVEIAPRSD